MNIIYNETKKDLPCDQLHRMFMSVGWSDGSETQDMIKCKQKRKYQVIT